MIGMPKTDVKMEMFGSNALKDRGIPRAISGSKR